MLKVVGHPVIERQHGLGTPDGDVAMDCPQLTVRELSRVALLQFIEYGPACALGTRRQLLAYLVPDCFERIFACAI